MSASLIITLTFSPDFIYMYISSCQPGSIQEELVPLISFSLVPSLVGLGVKRCRTLGSGPGL